MIPKDFTFLNPKLSILLFLLPIILLLFFYAEKKRKLALANLATTTILPQIALLRNSFRSFIKTLFFLLFWLFACVALMEPVGNEHFKNEEGKVFSQDLIFFIDSSLSMSVNDAPGKISRFEYAKEIADLVIQKLKNSDITLATFTTGATIIVPQTHDINYLRIRLKDLEFNEGHSQPGTDFLRSFLEIKSNNPSTLLLFSDGGDTSLEELSEPQKNERLEKILAAVSSSMTIYSIGMGSLKGEIIPKTQVFSKLDDDVLKAISKGYYVANEYTAETLADILVKAVEKNHFLSSNLMLRAYDEYFQLPLFLSLLFLFLFLFFSEIKGPLFSLFILSLSQILQANEEFVARQQYEAGNYLQAIQHYQDLLLKTPEAYHPLIQYNLGTISLAENKPMQALGYLEALPFAEELFPNVKKHALINIAAAYEALSQSSSDPLFKKMYLRKALQALYAANADGTAIKDEQKHFSLASLENNDLIVLLWEAEVKEQSLGEQLLQHIDNDAQKNLLADALKEQSIEKFKEFLDLYYKPRELLLADLNKFYTLETSKSLILFLLQKAKITSAEKNMLMSMEEEDVSRAYYFFLNSQKDFLKENEQEHLVKKALLELIQAANIVVTQELVFLNMPQAMVALKKEILETSQTVLDESGKLPQVIFEWQTLRFKQGICQCKPWDIVFPILREGNSLWQKDEISYISISSQKQAIQHWLKAYEMIESISEGPEDSSKASSETQNELQKMQNLDKQPIQQQQMPQGGKFW